MKIWFSRPGMARVVLCMAISSAGAVEGAESVVVVGAGTVGRWTTEVELANPSDGALSFQVGSNPRYESGCATPPPCPFAAVMLPPRGSARLSASEIFPGAPEGLNVMFVHSEDGITVPTVRARVFDTATPSLGVELPAARVSTISAHSSSTLIFPSVRRTATGHSNLILANIGVIGPIVLSVELYSTDGERLGGIEATLDALATLFFVDIVPTLGVESLEDGQIVVTRVGGTGIPWGYVALLDSSEGAIISQGWNP